MNYSALALEMEEAMELLWMSLVLVFWLLGTFFMLFFALTTIKSMRVSLMERVYGSGEVNWVVVVKRLALLLSALGLWLAAIVTQYLFL